MSLLDVVLVLGLALVAGLLVMVIARLRRPLAPDPRLDALARSVTTLDERTRSLPALLQDLTALKERTDQLPKKMEALAGHAALLPEASKQLVVLRERLGALTKIEHDLDELRGVFRSTTGKGQIGEEAIRAVLSQFPDDAWVEPLALPTGTVEFAVKTPNGLFLPIDSKTGGAEVVRDFFEASSGLEEARTLGDAKAMENGEAAVADCLRVINERVRRSARDIEKYIVPGVTTAFVVQALPDAVFDALDPAVRQEASDRGVLATPYSLLQAMASAVRRMEAHGEIDLARMSSALVKVRESTGRIEETVKNSVEKSATMATNAALAIRKELNAIETALLVAETLSTDGRGAKTVTKVQARLH